MLDQNEEKQKGKSDVVKGTVDLLLESSLLSLKVKEYNSTGRKFALLFLYYNLMSKLNPGQGNAVYHTALEKLPNHKVRSRSLHDGVFRV